MTIEGLVTREDVVKLVAETMKLSTRHVADKVIKRPDFPAPRRQVGRASVYAIQDIQNWFNLG